MIEVARPCSGALDGSEGLASDPMNGAAVLDLNSRKGRVELSKFVVVLKAGKVAKKKRFWSAYKNISLGLCQDHVIPAAFLPHAGEPFILPHWLNLEDDEAYVSSKRMAAIQKEIAEAWDNLFAEADTPFPDLFDPDFNVADLSEREFKQIQLAIHEIVQRYEQRKKKVSFKRDRSSRDRNDAVRADIHAYRVRTGISPPEMGPLWTKLSSDQTTDPISKENYHVPARRRAHSGCFRGTTQEGCPRKRRTPSRQANRHSARSYQARRLPDRRTGTHR